MPRQSKAAAVPANAEGGVSTTTAGSDSDAVTGRKTGYFVHAFPLRLTSSPNSRKHWRAVHAGRKQERTVVGWELRAAEFPAWLRRVDANSYRVRLTRHGKRLMDGDNLAAAFKAVRDEIALALGIDDGDRRVTWEYRQTTGKEYGVTVEIWRMG
jgi:hypothetical protein